VVVITVLSLLAPAAALGFLIFLALRSDEVSSGADGGDGGGGEAGGNGGSGVDRHPDLPRQPGGDQPPNGPQAEEPDWWPEFEREFALYVAHVHERDGEPATHPARSA
jgi:hypothetical protein